MYVVCVCCSQLDEVDAWGVEVASARVGAVPLQGNTRGVPASAGELSTAPLPAAATHMQQHSPHIDARTTAPRAATAARHRATTRQTAVQQALQPPDHVTTRTRRAGAPWRPGITQQSTRSWPGAAVAPAAIPGAGPASNDASRAPCVNTAPDEQQQRHLTHTLAPLCRCALLPNRQRQTSAARSRQQQP